MRHRRLSLATGTAVVCMVVLAACGSSNPTARFKAGYAADRGQLNAVFSEVRNTLTRSQLRSAADIGGTISVLAARFAKNLTPFQTLTAPARIATEFATLTSSLRRMESDLRHISLAAKRRSLNGALLAVAQFDSDARAATDAAVAIKRKLYTT